MLRVIRKIIAKIITSNRFTKAIAYRVALDEKILADLVDTEIFRIRIQQDAVIRKRFDRLVKEARPSQGTVAPDAIFVEPGLGTLHGILSNPRTIDVICSDRILLRQVIRNPQEQMAVADEVAQYGPVFTDALCSATGNKMLSNYMNSRAQTYEANELAQRLTSVMLDNGILHKAVVTDEHTRESMKKLASL